MNHRKKSVSILGSLAIVLGMVCNSCDKKPIAEVDNETQSVVDQALISQKFMGVLSTFFQAAINTKGVGKPSSNSHLFCDTLTLQSGDTLFGKAGHNDPTYWLNLSNKMCSILSRDDKTRDGHINIRFNGKLGNTATQAIIKNLSCSDAAGYSLSCDSIVIKTLSSGSSNFSFNVKLINGRSTLLEYPKFIKYDLDHTLNVMNYPNSGAYLSFYGTATGLNRNGRKFTTSISSTTPLVKELSCSFIGKGLAEITPEGFSTRTTDFGDGNCDEDANFSIKGNIIAFKLK